MRDPHDPDGQYEGQPLGGEAWTDQDYIRYVCEKHGIGLHHAMKRPSIADEIVAMVRKREMFGLETHGKPFTATTHKDNKKEAKEELIDALFYTTAALECLLRAEDED